MCVSHMGIKLGDSRWGSRWRVCKNRVLGGKLGGSDVMRKRNKR